MIGSMCFNVRHVYCIFVQLIDGLKGPARVVKSDCNDHTQCHSEDEAGNRQEELNQYKP